MRIGVDQSKKRSGIDASAAWHKNAGIATVPIKRMADAVCALELRRKGVRHSIELRSVRGQKRQAERSADHPFLGRRIGKSDFRPKAVPIFLCLKTVPATICKHKLARSAVFRINLVQIEIRPVAVLFMKGPRVLPA